MNVMALRQRLLSTGRRWCSTAVCPKRSVCASWHCTHQGARRASITRQQDKTAIAEALKDRATWTLRQEHLSITRRWRCWSDAVRHRQAHISRADLLAVYGILVISGMYRGTTVLRGTYHDTPTYNYGSIVPVYMIIVFNDAALSHCNVPGNDTSTRIVLYRTFRSTSIYRYGMSICMHSRVGINVQSKFPNKFH